MLHAPRSPMRPLSGNDDFNINNIGESLAGVLEKMVEVSSADDVAFTAEERQDMKTIFDACVPPAIAIRSYLHRIIKYVQCSTQSVIFSLIFIDRLIEQHALTVTEHNVHRLLLSAILVAAKSFDDEFYSNGFFSQVGGIPVQELNNLELEFLFLLQFNTFVSPEKYNQYLDSLIQAAAASRVLAPTVVTPTGAVIRRIQQCQMDPQNEPPSPKRRMEPQNEPPSPKRMNMSMVQAALPQKVEPVESSFISTSPFHPGTVHLSPSILCK